MDTCKTGCSLSLSISISSYLARAIRCIQRDDEDSRFPGLYNWMKIFHRAATLNTCFEKYMSQNSRFSANAFAAIHTNKFKENTEM